MDLKDSDEESDEDNSDSDDEHPETASDLVEGDIAVPDVSIEIDKELCLSIEFEIDRTIIK